MNISKIAYERYRLDWMMTHGYHLADLLRELELMQEESPDRDIATLFEDWEYGYGFNGTVWACYKEFVKNEYMDAEYMKSLLSAEEYKMYCMEVSNGF